MENLPLVSMTPVVKFVRGDVDTGVHLYLWISPRKNSKWPYCYFQGLGGRWFIKKTWSKKSRDTVPLRGKFTIVDSRYIKFFYYLNSVRKACHNIHPSTYLLYYKKVNAEEITPTVTSSDLELECEGLLEEDEFNGSMEPEEVRFLGRCSLNKCGLWNLGGPGAWGGVDLWGSVAWGGVDSRGTWSLERCGFSGAL